MELILGASSNDSLCPFPNNASHLSENVLAGVACLFEDLETVIGGVHQMKRRAFPEPLHGRLQKVEFRKCVTRSTQKQHRNLHRIEVLSPFCVRCPGRMKRKRKEHQP